MVIDLSITVVSLLLLKNISGEVTKLIRKTNSIHDFDINKIKSDNNYQKYTKNCEKLPKID